MMKWVEKLRYEKDRVMSALTMFFALAILVGVCVVMNHHVISLVSDRKNSAALNHASDMVENKGKTEDYEVELQEGEVSSWQTKAAQAALDAKSASVQAQEVAAQAKARADAIADSEAMILPGEYPIMGLSSITIQQMVNYYNANGGEYPASALGAGGAPDVETFCRIYYDEASLEGVRPEVAFAQTMKETGWLKYGGDASIAQYNFAGLGTTGGGVAGNSYPDVRTGVRAQIQHLKAYATDESLNSTCVDSRYDYVAKGSAPYVEWLGQQENPGGYGWATGINYGYDIVEMIHVMRSI